MDIQSLIRKIPNYPRPGETYYDLTTLLADGRGFRAVIEELAARLRTRYGRGFSTTNLRNFRTFYQVYADRTPEIRQTATGELGPDPASVKIRHTSSAVLDDLASAVDQADCKRDEAWRAFDQASREIDRQKDGFLDEMSIRLEQEVGQETLFHVRWRVA